jgi:hypothetical protein
MPDDPYRGIFNQQQQGPSKLHEEVERVVIKELEEDNAFEKTETVVIEDGAPRTTKTKTEHLMGCGHYASNRVEGKCQICEEQTLCRYCSRIRCINCYRVACSACITLKDDGTFICKACNRKKLTKSFFGWLHGFLAKDLQ